MTEYNKNKNVNEYEIEVCVKRTKFSARERFKLNVKATSKDEAIYIVHFDLEEEEVYQTIYVG
jgi:hypothetical protein